MELLDFSMPPFARVQWASKDIKEKYEPLFNKARRFFFQLEKASVYHGLRNVTTDHVDPKFLLERQHHYINNGLYFLPLDRVGTYEGYSSYHPKVEEGKPWTYYGVLANNIQDAHKFQVANFAIGEDGIRTDHRALGKLLGYPDCCTDFHTEQMVKGRIADPVWQQAMNMDEKHIRSFDEKERIITLKDVPWHANTLLRNWNLGPLFHMRCSQDCQHSNDMAEQWIELGKEIGAEGLAEMEMFLRMPMEWDCLKGIAYIKTPLFKASVNSATSKERYRVRFEGTYYPADAPKGIEYPWTMMDRMATIKRNENKLTYSSEGGEI